MSMEWIRKNYNVPAKRGMRIEYSGGRNPEYGVVRSASGGYLKIQLDGYKHTLTFHPTWKLRYL